ncbi:pyrroloquinoline quinone biosynthesis protein PqqB [Pseudomonas sp. Choline-3u-10]|jgi:pyrroloquinoline quinone biosynthesis protein B|uniref:pyrroloquinoline quinone biosynthesis protein PqqB n=1 Tax=Pseudomonadaceae TaxID=135621 RepID=UPI000617B198|nr:MULTISPECIES: pyrroloquinoline quinone biosynthesis protein PqqB [Pseudomonadaceae]MAL37958.1 pyrroloquinoline quinone biosynthesis protein PqqB [Pseudomonas sp.]MBU0948919.1 pyrroloquinoline quinone biosynthesis protein PqqB [Gammaproteobacteria bacterium]KJJ65151.1 pyrroloquinoline quinone biosynthesis protein PqqB [Pseudomonas sp. 10B238]MBK3795630.1 pyrroloquinoline quinone biosynthesis protein PqqB [Stutzerimonas stutzeri]MBK3878015.1 pyrroloquinoline quinone biosynthesis protein PqqB |tara:strand:+ start:739 stop:1650 length:912 start_codon:yes stop_codon:yes gene_type:complete
MFIQILGSAAGGGFPQWNCNCVNCAGLRNGSLRAKARTQSSIAISDDGENWILCNASPDIRAQLESFPKLQPARGPRDTAIGAIILLDSQIDHTTGLLTLREGCPHEVWCTEMVHQDLSTGFPLFKMLEHWNGGLRWNPIALEGSFTIATCPNLNITPIPLRSSAPPYSPHRNDPHPGDNIGLLIEDRKTGGTLFYAPGLGQVSPELLELMRGADCLLVDGTLWRDDEMRVREVGTKLGSEMGHLHQSGPGGMIEVLDGMPAARKILIHINNTNPILDEDSAERAVLDEHGIEVSFDGMSIEL